MPTKHTLDESGEDQISPGDLRAPQVGEYEEELVVQFKKELVRSLMKIGKVVPLVEWTAKPTTGQHHAWAPK